MYIKLHAAKNDIRTLKFLGGKLPSPKLSSVGETQQLVLIASDNIRQKFWIYKTAFH